MVTHCVCHDLSLEDLKRLAMASGLDIDGLKNRTGACTTCGYCEPYVRLMLRTGQTTLPILDRRTCNQLMDGSFRTAKPGEELAPPTPTPTTAAA